MEDKIVQSNVYHKNYNLDKKDNLDTLPTEAAVFGVFAIIHEKPVHCRFVGETTNLQQAIRDLFEKPEGEGMKKFMQGPWYKLVLYELMPEETDRKAAVEKWTKEHSPKIDDKGEYPR
ncbi:MAG: hypothetical protein ACM3SY_03555 [Candidatus Omnitrophota bacterium]